MTILTAILANQLYSGIAGGILLLVAGPILKFILSKIPTEAIKKKFGSVMYSLGCIVTLGLAKWKITKTVWNSTLEPWIIVFLDGLISYGLSEFIRGLRSDNQD